MNGSSDWKQPPLPAPTESIDCIPIHKDTKA